MQEHPDKTLTDHVRQILRSIRDVEVREPSLPGDTGYDSGVTGVVELVQDTAMVERDIVEHLARLETVRLGLTRASEERIGTATRALLGLREAVTRTSDTLVNQIVSPDGRRALWIFERIDGLFVYEQAAFREETDVNGAVAWWSQVGAGRSGLYQSAQAAEQDAQAAIGWLSGAHPPNDLRSAEDAAAVQECWRAMTAHEKAVLDRLFAPEFPGRRELVAQSRAATVRRIDRDGSLRFKAAGARAEISRRVPVEGRYCDHHPDPRPPWVNLLLHVVDGRLHELEVYKDDGSAIVTSPFSVEPTLIEVFVG